jgi:sulfate adenylyltransferase subunit 1 (EFTu-like GTPase family)
MNIRTLYGVRRHEVSSRQWLTNCLEARAGLELARDAKVDDIEEAEHESGNAHARARVTAKMAGELDTINGQIIALENEITSAQREAVAA